MCFPKDVINAINTITHSDISNGVMYGKLPLTPKEDASYPAACFSVLPPSNLLSQAATEQIIQSVSSPW